LKKNYYVSTNSIKLSDIISHPKKDLLLFNITDGRYTKRVKSNELIFLLKKYGYKNLKAKSNYIKFTRENFFDLSLIKNKIKMIYRVNYQNIVFKNIELHSRGYIENLPEQYSVQISSKNYLKNSGVLSIKSLKTKKQFFFNYKIDADITVYYTKDFIQRKEELSLKNCSSKKVPLKKFRALPVQLITKRMFQSKHNIKKGTIVTLRDIQKFNLVRRGSTLNVTLRNGNINISFSAVALQDGVYGDIIKVKQNNSKIIKVKIIGFKLASVL